MIASKWRMSSCTDRAALDVVDGMGPHQGHGPHYSRRTPGSARFTGIGQEVVFVTEDLNAVWSVVRQRTPLKGKTYKDDTSAKWVWRNNMFRNLGNQLSSDLIRAAVEKTYAEWERRYGGIPTEPLRTEVAIARVRSSNPGYCYLNAGWTKQKVVRGKLYLLAPSPHGILK